MEKYDKKKPLLISMEVFSGLIKVAKERHLDLAHYLDRFQLNKRVFFEAKGYIPFHIGVELLEVIAAEQQIDDLGFQVANHSLPTNLGMTTAVLKYCPDLYTAIQEAQTFGHLTSQEALWGGFVEDEYFFAIRQSKVTYDYNYTHYLDLAIVLAMKAISALLDNKLQPSGIYFQHSPTSRTQVIARMFSCPVHFKHEFNGFSFPKKYLDYKIPTADYKAYKAIKAHLNKITQEQESLSTVVHQVEFLIKKNLGTTRCNLESIAEKLYYHPRTLQRLLQKHGVIFNDLLLSAKLEMAKYYLRNSNMSLSEISDILGYSNQSAFSRIFKLQQNLTPKAWREHHHSAQIKRLELK